MCVILPLFYRAHLVVAQYITTSIKEINIAIYHTNVLAIYFLDGVWRWRGSRQSNVLLSDCPAGYLVSRDRTKICSVIYRKTGQIKFYSPSMSIKESTQRQRTDGLQQRALQLILISLLQMSQDDMTQAAPHACGKEYVHFTDIYCKMTIIRKKKVGGKGSVMTGASRRGNRREKLAQ